MSQRKDGLTCWRELQQAAFDQEKLATAQARHKLEEEQARLDTLDGFQRASGHSEGSCISALELSGGWQFRRQLDQVIRHQRQQLAVEQAQCRRREMLLKEQQKTLKTADKLLEKRQAVQHLHNQRREQKMLDELSAGFALGRYEES